MLLLSSLVIIASLAVSCAYDTSFLSEMLKDSIKPITLANRNDAILSMKESIMATPTQRTAHNASSVNAASAVREVFGEIRELQSNGFDDAGKNGRKLQASFTCEPPQGFNPFSQCSDIVDYPFLVPANSNLYEMEYAVRLSIDFTEIPYVDNVCLTDYKRMRCAQIYMPCVAGVVADNFATYDPVTFSPMKLPCKSLCEAASSSGSTCAGTLEGLGMDLDCDNAALFDPSVDTCNAMTASTFGPITVAPHKEPYAGQVCTGYVTETYLAPTSAITVPGLPPLPPLLPPFVQQSLVEMMVAPLIDSVPRYFQDSCLTNIKRMFCGLNYMPPYELNTLQNYFGLVQQPQFPSQSLCQDYTSSCAGAIGMVPALSMNCAAEAAPGLAMFPSNGVGVVGAYFPPLAMPVTLMTPTNDAVPVTGASVKSQCPYGYSLERVDGFENSRYIYMLPGDVTECKMTCPSAALGVLERFQGFRLKYSLWHFFYSSTCALILFNVLTQDPAKRNNVLVFSITFSFCISISCLLYQFTSGFNCVNDVVWRDGSVNAFADLLIIPLALIKKVWIFYIIGCNMIITLEIWLRVYWKLKNVDELKKIYIPAIAIVYTTYAMLSMEDQKIDQETGLVVPNRWITIWGMDSLPLARIDVESTMYDVDRVVMLASYAITTAVTMHMLVYCIRISMVAVKNNEEGALVKLWKTYRTLILLNIFFQFVVIASFVLIYFFYDLFPSIETAKVNGLSDWFQCVIGTFTNLENDPSGGSAGCGQRARDGETFLSMNAYDISWAIALFALFMSTFTDALSKRYWDAMPNFVQNFLSFFSKQTKVGIVDKTAKDLGNSVKSVEMTKPANGPKAEETKEVA